MILLFFPEKGKRPDWIDIYDGINENQEQKEKTNKNRVSPRQYQEDRSHRANLLPLTLT